MTNDDKFVFNIDIFAKLLAILRVIRLYFYKVLIFLYDKNENIHNTNVNQLALLAHKC